MAKFDPSDMLFIIYTCNGDYQTLLHTKYRSPGPCGFREDFFFVFFFSIVSLWVQYGSYLLPWKTTILIQSAPKCNAINPATQ